MRYTVQRPLWEYLDILWQRFLRGHVLLWLLLMVSFGVALWGQREGTRMITQIIVPAAPSLAVTVIDIPSVSFVLPARVTVPLINHFCDIRDFGAFEGGKEKNTEAIARAVAACAQAGGGIVRIPSGVWLTGPITLESHVTLFVEHGAELRFSTDKKDYLPPVFSRYEGIELYNYAPLISAVDAEDVAIVGTGILNGQGAAWQIPGRLLQRQSSEKLYVMGARDVPVDERIFGDTIRGLRPSFFDCIRCRHVIISGVTFVEGPMWTIHSLYSEDVGIAGITVKTVGPNTDGVVIDSSRNVAVIDSLFTTGDDAIAIKSGTDHDGWRVGRPSEHIVIAHNHFQGGVNGVAVGSEMSGDVRGVLVYDSLFNQTERGLRFKTKEGRGGIVENIIFQKAAMNGIAKEGISFNMDYNPKIPNTADTRVPKLRHIRVADITMEHTTIALSVLSVPAIQSEDISFERISAQAQYGAIINQAMGLNFSEVCVRTSRGVAFSFMDSQKISFVSGQCTQPVASFMSVRGNQTADFSVTVPTTLKKGISVPTPLKKRVTLSSQ